MIYIFMVATIRHAFVQCTRVFQILESTSFLILGSPSPSTWALGGGTLVSSPLRFMVVKVTIVLIRAEGSW